MANPQTLERNQAAALPAEEDGLYEVVGGKRKELEPMGFFEVTLASELGGFLREFVKIKKLGLVVNEGLFVLDSEKNLKRRPDVAFISYSRCPDPTVSREEATDHRASAGNKSLSPGQLG